MIEEFVRKLISRTTFSCERHSLSTCATGSLATSPMFSKSIRLEEPESWVGPPPHIGDREIRESHNAAVVACQP